MSGSIPPALGTLTNLQGLYLSFNQLSGSIPSQIGSLTNLTRLYLNNNQLSGSIPPALANLTKVSYLALANNELDPNVTDAALLAWLDARLARDNWRNQRVPIGENRISLPMIVRGR